MRERWFDRTFELGLPPAAAPAIVERLRGAPDRLTAATAGLPPHILTHRPDGRWSINENVGHLLDLEELWATRLDDFERGAPVLAPADLQNRRTHEAGHNERPLADLIERFGAARSATLQRVAAMDAAALARSSRHPRLDQPMSVVDLCFFVAEHDDHHVAAIEEIAAAYATFPAYALRLLSTVDRVLPALKGMPPEETRRRPAPGKWSPREVVGHLIDSASNNHQRFVRAMSQDDLVFDGYEQDEWVAAQRYQEARWEDLLDLWSSFNKHLARVMAAIPEATRMRPHRRHNLHLRAWRAVPAAEPATLDYFMNDYVAHLEHHLRQIPAAAPLAGER